MNSTSRTSRKNKSKVKQQNKNRSNGKQNSNRYNGQQNTNSSVSKKQQAMLNAPVKFRDEVLVTIHVMNDCFHLRHTFSQIFNPLFLMR